MIRGSRRTVLSRGRAAKPLPGDPKRIARLRRALLRWGELAGRAFFWREPNVSPFAVLVAEILLAKTRAEVVAPVAAELLMRFPAPSALAQADMRELRRLLRPLGLHRKRARQLIDCATRIVADHGGTVPNDVDSLMELPSVGRYAANAIACVAFDQRRSVIDANVSRIYGRVFSLPPPPARLSAAEDLWDLATRLLPRQRSKEFNWAILDLGASVCTAKNPRCDSCPIAELCSTGMPTGRPGSRAPRGRLRSTRAT